MTRVVITGEQSSLAQALARDLLSRSSYTVVHSHLGSCIDGPYRLMSGEAGIAELDLADSQVVEAVVASQPDVLINAAGLVSSATCYGRELVAYRANVQTAWNVRAIAERLPDLYVVNLGTAASYARQGLIIDEETPPAYYQTLYAHTKQLGEQILMEGLAERLLALRILFVYGELAPKTSLLARLVHRHYQRDTTPLTVNMDIWVRKEWLYLSDFVSTVGELMRGGVVGPYVISNPLARHSFMEVLHILKGCGVETGGVSYEGREDSTGEYLSSVGKYVGVGAHLVQGRVPLVTGVGRVVEGIAAQYES